MRWWRHPAVVVVGAAVLGLGAWWSVAQPTAAPEPTPTRSLALDVGEILDRVPGCRREACRLVDRRDGFEYQGRPAAIVVVEEPGSCDPLAPASVHLVARGEPLWSGPSDTVCGDPAGGITVDDTGHAFLRFPRPEGGTHLVVLAVSGEDVADFGSFAGRFTGGHVTLDDLQGDGVYEIVVGSGTERRVFGWTGREYTERQ